MKRERLLTLLGSVCLAVMLLVPLAASCGPAAPEEAAEEIAALESKLAAEKSKVSSLQGDVSDLEAEIAALRAPGEVIEWRFASWAPRGIFYFDEIFCGFCREVGEISNGRIEVEPLGVGELVGWGNVFDALQAEVVDVGCPFVASYDTIMPEMKCSYGLPVGLRSGREVLELVWERGWEEILREAYLEQGLYYLAPDVWNPMYTVTKVPCGTLDELRELKIKATGGGADLLGKLGSTAVTVASAEIYMAIATGVVDGCLGIDLGELYNYKFYEFAKYIMKPPFLAAVIGSDYLVTEDTWNSLSEELQVILYETARLYSSQGDVKFTKDEREGTLKMLEAGCEYVYLDDAGVKELTGAAVEMWDEVAALSPRNAKMIEIYKNFMKDLGYME